MELITFSLICFVLLLLYISTRKADLLRAMPGPPRVPIFGNVQFNFPKLHLQFTEYARKYGEIYRIQILSQPVVVVNSYNAFKEVYSRRGKDFLGRPNMFRFQVIGAHNGVAFRDISEKQSLLRSKAVKALRSNGLIQLDWLISENLSDLVQLFREHNSMAFDPKDVIKKFLINIVFGLIFGEKAAYDDPVLDKIMRFNEAAVEAAAIGKEDIDVWPWTKYFNPNYKLAVKAREEFTKSIQSLYKKYKDTYTPNHQRSVIDQYIEEVIKGDLTDEEVHGCLIDFLVGGVETTASTLYGFILILLGAPCVQKRLQIEIDGVIGKDRYPSHSDRNALPYVEACLLELFRYQSILPFLVPRKATEDTEICGYHVPKNTWVFTNAWAIHHNEDIYPDAHTYKPERFLSPEGSILPQCHISRKSLVTFGLGKRHCIGESLAKTRLFITICTLMQNFTFVSDSSHPLPSSDSRDYNLKIVFDVNPYMLKAIPR